MKIETWKFGAGLSAVESNTHWNDPAYLGGKGAHLQIMAKLGVPVPPGFTIPTKHCVEFMNQGPAAAVEAWQNKMIQAAVGAALDGMGWLIDYFGYTPLVSVRSGAPISMPGMMDTILNVGLYGKDAEHSNLAEWAGRIGPWATLDSYRRLIQMLGTTAVGIDGEAFEDLMAEARKKDDVATDKEISLERLGNVVDAYKAIWAAEAFEFPDDPGKQLELAIGAVWRSWQNPRAVEYRNLQGIPHDMGTAVTVQSMVFGNMNDNSGSGVLFTRNPNTGEPGIFAEYLTCAQGEDVVAGIRTPDKLNMVLKDLQEDWQIDLFNTVIKLEQHYKDVQDVEFTVQDGQLFLLQTRSAKRSATAAVRIAFDLYQEGVLTQEEALQRVTAKQYLTAKQPVIDPKAQNKVLGTGLAACPGVATGVIATSSAQAVELAKQGLAVILVTHETTPDDIAGMIASKGILTATGGATSHAAVVARALDKPCVVGCSDLQFALGQIAFNTQVAAEAEIGWLNAATNIISLDGGTGRVFEGEVPVLSAEGNPAMEFLEEAVLASQGVVPRGSQPRLSENGLYGYVVAADWFDDPQEGVSMFLSRLEDYGANRLFLDLRDPQDHATSDQRLTRTVLGGKKPLAQRLMAWRTEITEVLKKPSLLAGVVILNSGFVFTDLQRNALRKAGAIIPGGPAKTVADVLKGGFAEITPQFIKDVIGGDEAWAQLQKALPPVQTFALPQTATVEEAAFAALK